jgi:uncharacterized repeat protein (TIGR01451 family)
VGPSDAVGVTVSDTIPANTTFVSLTTPADFVCTTPAVGGTGAINCSKPSNLVATGSMNFTLVVNVNAGTANGTVITNTASIAATTTDPNGGNNSATATTTVGAGSADVSVAKTDTPDPVIAGSNVTYTITVNNAGPSNATTAALADTLPTGTRFVSLSSPGGWSCTTPAVGGIGTVNCSIATLGVTSAVFTLTVNADSTLANGTVLSNTATASSATTDPNGANNSDTETTTVNTSADVQVTKVDTPDPVTAGTNITYTINAINNGPSNAANANMSDTTPTNTTFVSVSAPAGWSCTSPAVGGTGAVSCTKVSMAVGTETITLVVAVNGGTAGGTVISNTATMSSATTDPTPGNNNATATTTVTTGSTLSQITATKSAVSSGVPASPVTYTVVITNNMTHVQGDNPGDEFLDVLPSQLTLVSANATSGTPLANTGTNTVTWNGSLAANGGTVTITINATINANATGTISNQGTVFVDLDNNGTNESSAPTNDPSTVAADDATTFTALANAPIPALSPLMLLALAALLGFAALLKMMR